MLKTVQLVASFLLFTSLCSCNKSPSEAEKDERIQEEAAKIAAERERLAELQQEQREKVAADLASRTDTREAKRATNLEQAAAEQARREGITSELATFIDTLWIEVMQGNATEALRLNGQPAEPGSIIVSPAGYSVTYTGHDGDYFSFTYDEDAFTLTLKKPAAGLSLITTRAKQPLADGFKVGQPLAGVPSDGFSAGKPTSSRGLLSSQVWSCPLDGTVSGIGDAVTLAGSGNPAIAVLRRRLPEVCTITGEAFISGQYAGFVLGYSDADRTFVSVYSSGESSEYWSNKERERTTFGRVPLSWQRNSWTKFAIHRVRSEVKLTIGSSQATITLPSERRGAGFGVIEYYGTTVQLRNISIR